MAVSLFLNCTVESASIFNSDGLKPSAVISTVMFGIGCSMDLFSEGSLLPASHPEIMMSAVMRKIFFMRKCEIIIARKNIFDFFPGW